MHLNLDSRKMFSEQKASDTMCRGADLVMVETKTFRNKAIAWLIFVVIAFVC
jgi:hypothetical protein